MDRASIAEAKGDLGHFLFLNGSKIEGTRMLQEAAEVLCEFKKEAFASRIKLKLAEVYVRQRRLRSAIKEVREADAICQYHGITLREPAGWSARLMLQVLRRLKKNRPLRVIAGDNGYRFIE